VNYMDRESEKLTWEGKLWSCHAVKGLTPFIFRPTHSPNARAQTLLLNRLARAFPEVESLFQPKQTTTE
jgi:hypothetical protein